MNDHSVPCVVFAFNRPAKLKRILAALQRQKVGRLVIFVDGPRRAEEAAPVEACRELARQVSWAEVELYLWEENHGLIGLLDNIDRVMEKYPSAIFVEDDCLPLPGFYELMCACLEHYQEDRRVFSIGGYQLLPKRYFRNYAWSLVSSARFTCWGWATWRDRWEETRPVVDRLETLFDGLTRIPDTAGADLPEAGRAIARSQIKGSWDTRVALATLWLKKVHLLPAAGKIKNIGQDPGGIHGSRMGFLRSMLLQNKNLDARAADRIAWLPDTTLDAEYTCRLNDYVLRASGLADRQQTARARRVLNRTLQRRPERHENLAPDLSGSQAAERRALVSYITHPFSIPRSDPRFYRHINIWHAEEIVRSLNRLGFIVDVIDYRDTGFVPQKPYDLFLGHGGVNFTGIASRLPPAARKIYFSTGSYWQFHNQAEQQRFADLKQRRGIDLPADRYIHNGEEQALQVADAIFAIGNQATRETYRQFDNVYMLPITTLYDDRVEWFPKDYDQGRKQFLYYAGGGAVHKGLDLILEAFSGTDFHLWVCGRIEADFERAYTRELHEMKNIHLARLIQPRGCRYYELTRRCNYALLASCSEGSAHSVVECMNQGLIPAVTRASGIDIDSYGRLLEPPTVGEIRRAVEELAGLSPEQCRQQSESARQAALTVYAEQAFSSHLDSAFEAILTQSQPAGER